MNKKLSIIIVTYNNKYEVINCIYSIKEHIDIDDYEIIIVDNSPTNQTSNLILTEFSDIYLYKNNENRGFGYGNNIGVIKSRYDYILFLNPDTLILEPMIKDSLELLENRKLSAIGYRFYDKEMKPTLSYAKMPDHETWADYFNRRILSWILQKRGQITINNYYPWGACFLVRKSDFINAGMFDDSIFLNYEEPDLMKRMPYSRILILNKFIQHIEGVSKKEIEDINLLKSEEYFFKKYNLDYDKFLKMRSLKKRIFNLISLKS